MFKKTFFGHCGPRNGKADRQTLSRSQSGIGHETITPEVILPEHLPSFHNLSGIIHREVRRRCKTGVSHCELHAVENITGHLRRMNIGLSLVLADVTCIGNGLPRLPQGADECNESSGAQESCHDRSSQHPPSSRGHGLLRLQILDLDAGGFANNGGTGRCPHNGSICDHGGKHQREAYKCNQLLPDSQSVPFPRTRTRYPNSINFASIRVAVDPKSSPPCQPCGSCERAMRPLILAIASS